MKLIKLTKEEILQLQPSDEVFHVELRRLFFPERKLIWKGDSKLFIQRAKAYRKLPERLSVITPKQIQWAEGCYKDVFDNGDVVVEDYQMEIFRKHESKIVNSYKIELWTDEEKIRELRALLLTILDQIDYTQNACSVTEMVGAVLDKRLLELAHAILEKSRF